MRKKNTIKYILKAVTDEYFTEMCFSKSWSRRKEALFLLSTRAAPCCRTAPQAPCCCWEVSILGSTRTQDMAISISKNHSGVTEYSRPSHLFYLTDLDVFLTKALTKLARDWLLIPILHYNSRGNPSFCSPGQHPLHLPKTLLMADKKNLSLISDKDNKNPIFKQKALYAINHELILWLRAKKGYFVKRLTLYNCL